MPEKSEHHPARIVAIRRQIANETYETPLKLEIAVERLLPKLATGPPQIECKQRPKPK